MAARTVRVGCVLAMLALSACGSTTKPVAGSGGTRTLAGGLAPGRGVIDDPRTKPLPCLKRLRLGVLEPSTDQLLIGAGTRQARIVFLATPGAAQGAQISGSVQGAEVIGNALLYPQEMSDAHLKSVEDCLARGVQG